MSEHLDPEAAVNEQRLLPDVGRNAAVTDLGPQSAQQGSDAAPSSLVTLLHAMSEPSLLHVGGRIVCINDALQAVLHHPSPERLSGLPASALVESTETQLGRERRVRLVTGSGPVAASLSTLDVELSEGRGTLWIFGAPTASHHDLNQRAARGLEAYCDRIWDQDGGQETRLIPSFAEVIDQLAPPDHDTMCVSVDMSDAVSMLVPRSAMDVMRTGRVDGSPEAVHHLLSTLMRRLAPDTRVRVDVDVSGRPLVVLRRDAGVAAPAADVRAAQVMAAGLRGSVVTLDEGRVVRLRLQSAPALPCPTQRA
ncbi:MAG: hypothetical protein AB8H79_00965 [Myxococcota bacterium]